MLVNDQGTSLEKYLGFSPTSSEHNFLDLILMMMIIVMGFNGVRRAFGQKAHFTKYFSSAQGGVSDPLILKRFSPGEPSTRPIVSPVGTRGSRDRTPHLPMRRGRSDDYRPPPRREKANCAGSSILLLH